MNKKRIAIIGAGIGGMTTAVALSQKNINVSIFEQAPVLSEVGAGLTVTPKCYKRLDVFKSRKRNRKNWNGS